jgi:hypothetical protein
LSRVSHPDCRAAVVFLKDVLKRMERHQSKETALLGPLHSWLDLAIKSDGARL